MRTVEQIIHIQAPPATIWQILTATDEYAHWNPFMTQLHGRLAVGERLRVTIRPEKRSMTFRPTVLAIDKNALIRWRGRLGVPGLFDGEHELRLEGTADGGTRFIQRETFTGLLVPMVRRVLEDTETGFVSMNGALRDRATSRTMGTLMTSAKASLSTTGSMPKSPPRSPSDG